MSGAAPLPIDVARRVAEKYEVEVVQGYGMTEASPVTHISLLGQDKPGTVGPPVADTRQKVVDLATGEELGVGETGELLVQGPQVMAGYFNRPDATEETLLTDDDGVWLRTGDIVTVDDDAYVTIRDRAKEMIKYKGYQIAPAELEAVLIEHPDIADAAVIPKDSGNGIGRDPEGLRGPPRGRRRSAPRTSWPSSRSAWRPYKKVREVEFIDAIPKNPSGKILRRELKEKERAPHEHLPALLHPFAKPAAPADHFVTDRPGRGRRSSTTPTATSTSTAWPASGSPTSATAGPRWPTPSPSRPGRCTPTTASTRSRTARPTRWPSAWSAWPPSTTPASSSPARARSRSTRPSSWPGPPTSAPGTPSAR